MKLSPTHRYILKIGVTLLLLAFLAFQVDWGRLQAALWEIRLAPFWLSCGVLVLCLLPLGLRLRALLRPTVLQFRLSRLIQVICISQMYALLLPSSVGVIVARWYKITQNKMGRRLFALVTLIERILLIMTLLLCTLLPLSVSRDERILTLKYALLPPMLVLLSLCLLFFLCFYSKTVLRWVSNLLQWLQPRAPFRVLSRVLGVHEDIELYARSRGVFLAAFGYHLVFLGLTLFRFYLLFIAMNVELPLLTILWITTLILMVQAAPITLAGLGLREGGFAWLFSLYAVPPERGVLLGALVFVQIVLNSLLGAVVNVLEKNPPVPGEAGLPASPAREERSGHPQ